MLNVFKALSHPVRLQILGLLRYDLCVLADAILDRLLHMSHRITLKGESMRATTKNPIS